MIEHLIFSDGPKRVGPFSHAVKSDEYLFVTGQMPTLKDNPSKLQHWMTDRVAAVKKLKRDRRKKYSLYIQRMLEERDLEKPERQRLMERWQMSEN